MYINHWAKVIISKLVLFYKDIDKPQGSTFKSPTLHIRTVTCNVKKTEKAENRLE
jgi:hypothetical protein